MDALDFVRTNAEPCTDDDDDGSSSAEYRTVSADYTNDEGTATATDDYKTVTTADGEYRDGQQTSVSDYSRLSTDNDNGQLKMTIDEQKATDYECKICTKFFKTLQACLRHELVDHNNKSGHSDRKTPQKAVRLALKTYSALEKGDHQANQQRVHQILQNCERGLELHELLKVFCMSDEKARDIGIKVRKALQHDLQPIHNLSIYNFGSIMNGLMTWDSDVDVYVTTEYQNERGPSHRQPVNQARLLFNRINALLRRSGRFDEIVTIRNARVPIIKCRHPATGMKVDINCSCPNSVVNSQFLNNLLRFDVRLRSMMRFLKIWTKQIKLIGRGNMTSYCLTTLVLFSWQQPLGNRPPVVPSIKHLQLNVPAKYVEGINYAYDIHRYMTPLPLDLTSNDLLRNFFAYYRNFDFSKTMVTPYLGNTISMDDWKSGDFQYFDYDQQLQIMRDYSCGRYDVEDLNIDRCMVVQDPFQLNQNIARGVAGTHLEYFRKCVEYAYHICMNNEIKSSAELYERLLFDVISQIEADARALRESVGQHMVNDSPNELLFSFMPSRVELRALAHYQMNLNNLNNANNFADNANSNLYREWMCHYIEAIYAILDLVYRIKVRTVSTTTEKEDTDTDELTHAELIQSFCQIIQEKGELVWHISCTRDLWTGRTYNRQNVSTFMEYQIKQTEKLLAERANIEAFAVDVHGLLTIKPSDGLKSLALLLTRDNPTQTYLTKKDPLRKFFTNFRNSMQNFNLKEKLQAESGRKPNAQINELKIWKKSETAPPDK